MLISQGFEEYKSDRAKEREKERERPRNKNDD